MLGPELLDLRARDRPSEQLGLDRLRRDEHVVVVAADRSDEPAHVLAVGDHRVGVAVDVPCRGQRQQMSARARLRPDRRPQHERAPMQPRAGIRSRQDRAAGERGDHGLVVARGADRVRGTVEPARRERSVSELGIEVGEPGRDVALAAAEAQHLEPVPVGESPVERDPVRGQVVREQRDRHRGSTLAQSPAAMRVLLLHNRYRQRGGEERAVGDIAALLSARGHTVEVLERSSADAAARTAARGMLLGGIDPDEVARAVRTLRAEIVHAHNVHPLLGWRSLAAARAAGARTVLHLHNFRLFCAVAIGYRDGAPCFRCRGADTRPGLRLRCRGPVAEAAVYAAGLHRQQRRLFEHTDRFIVVSAATAARLRWLGLPGDGGSLGRRGLPGETGRSATLPNFAFDDAFVDASVADQGAYALISGRLVPEKGFDTAIVAAGAAAVPLVIAGDGPDEPRLRRLAASGADVRFAGRLEPSALAELRARAAVVLVPSRWEEPCPYAVIDALAAGVPVLASDRGGLPELVGHDATVGAEDAGAWAGALRQLWEDPCRRKARGDAGLARARERFGEQRYYEALIGVYQASMVGT